MNWLMNLSNSELMTLHCRTLFCLDDNNRLRTINEPGYPEPPRFWMGRTLQGNQWHFRHALPTTTAAALEELCQAEPIATDLRQPPQNAPAIKAVLAKDTPIRSEYRGPAYWVSQGADVPQQAILITAANAELLRTHFADLLEPDAYHLLGPVAAVVEEGCAVAVAFCSRLPGKATEAGVHTHETYRRRGYAASVIAAWAEALYQQDCFPLYSTSWDNQASQGVAQKLGMVCYGEDWSLQ